MKETYLSTRDLAKRWSMSHRTLDNWRWAGKGPRYEKIGHAVVYPLKWVLVYESRRDRR